MVPDELSSLTEVLVIAMTLGPFAFRQGRPRSRPATLGRNGESLASAYCLRRWMRAALDRPAW